MKSLSNFHTSIKNLLTNNCGETTTTSISTSTPIPESCESQFNYLSAQITNISLLYETALHNSELKISESMDHEQSEIQNLIQSSSSSQSCKDKLITDFDVKIPANLYTMCINDVELMEESELETVQLALMSLQKLTTCNELDASGQIPVSLQSIFN